MVFYCDVWWVNISNGIPANNNITIYMYIGSSSANYYQQYYPYVGEAPQLSSTYGQYDNGNYVFSVYYNFAGTTLDSRISTINGVTLTQNNGLTIGVTSTTTTFYILTSSYVTAPFIMEVYETYYGVPTSSNSNEQWGLVIDSSTFYKSKYWWTTWRYKLYGKNIK